MLNYIQKEVILKIYHQTEIEKIYRQENPCIVKGNDNTNKGKGRENFRSTKLP